MAEVDLTIAGRPYRVACRAGEEDSLLAAAALVDAKSREALAGMGATNGCRGTGGVGAVPVVWGTGVAGRAASVVSAPRMAMEKTPARRSVWVAGCTKVRDGIG